MQMTPALSKSYEFIQHTLFKLQSTVSANGYLESSLSLSIEEYYMVIRYHFLKSQPSALADYLNRNTHFANHPFYRVANLMLTVLRIENLTHLQLQNYYNYFFKLETSVARAEGLMYVAFAAQNQFADWAIEILKLCVVEFKCIGLHPKSISCSVSILNLLAGKIADQDMILRYECLYRESLETPSAYSQAVIQHNLAELFFKNNSLEQAKKHLNLASQHASKTEIPRTYYSIQILKCKVSHALEVYLETASELEDCLNCAYKDIRREAEMLIKSRTLQNRPGRVDFEMYIEKYHLTPNEMKLLRLLCEGESDIKNLGLKLYGYIPADRSLDNRINNLISRIRKKTKLHIKKETSLLRLA